MQTKKQQTWQVVSTWRRWLTFNLVGLAGIPVHMGALAAMTMGLGWNYLLSTMVAVEIAVLHNFVWHERWTWADRTSRGFSGLARRLGRFHAANGTISFLGNLFLMWLFAGVIGVHPVVSGMMAIAICSLANFLASDRWVFRGRSETMKAQPFIVAPERLFDPEREEHRLTQEVDGATASRRHDSRRLMVSGRILIVAIGLLMVQVARLEAAELRPETVKAWSLYVSATERRIEQELGSQKGFLALDFLSRHAGLEEREALLAGEIPVMKMATVGSDRKALGIPFGMIHHWRGSVFIPGIDIDLVMSRIVNPGIDDTRQEDVLDSRVLDRGPDSLLLYLKLRRVKFVTVVYNTEHAIRYGRRAKKQAFSRSVATRIAEVENADSADEREKPIGQDRGFLWRLNSYWRYEQVNGGVIVECESISLSRTVPGFLEFMIRPLIDSAARESMSRTLGSMRDRLVLATQQNAAVPLAFSSRIVENTPATSGLSAVNGPSSGAGRSGNDFLVEQAALFPIRVSRKILRSWQDSREKNGLVPN